MFKQNLQDNYNLPITYKELSSFATVLFESSPVAILILDVIGKITAINFALSNLIGYEKEEVLGYHPKFLFAGQSDDNAYRTFIKELVNNSSWSGTVMGRKKNGSVLPMDIQFFAISDSIGTVNHYVGICSSFYSYISQNEDVAFNPNLDPLTNILNQNAFLHKLDRAIVKVEKNISLLSVLYINIDHFHELASQDNYRAGDTILKNMAMVLSHAVEDPETVARLKSDIFTVILQDLYTQEDIEEEVSRIYDAITEPFVIYSSIERISVSIGVATFSLSGDNSHDLLNSATEAAKRAKNRGGNQICYDKKLTDIAE